MPVLLAANWLDRPSWGAHCSCRVARLVAPFRSVDADIVDDGRRAFGWRRYLRYEVNLLPAFILQQRAGRDVDPARPGVEDSADAAESGAMQTI